MPISQEYGGHGMQVMKNMAKQYGTEEGKRVFYATLNKRKHEGNPMPVKKPKSAAEKLRALQRIP